MRVINNDYNDRAGLLRYVQFNETQSHTYTHNPRWEDQCKWHRMARTTGPDCAVMCKLKNTHKHPPLGGSMRAA